MRRAFPILVALAAVAACDEAGSTLVPRLSDGLPSTCSPLRTPGACMMPWPNAIYLKSDATTVTGYRVALTPETLPVGVDDGRAARRHAAGTWPTVSRPATSAIYYFAERIDPASLVPETNIAASLQPGRRDGDRRHGDATASSRTSRASTRTSSRTATGRRCSSRRRSGCSRITATPSPSRTPCAPSTAARPRRRRSSRRCASGTAPPDPLSQAQLARMPDILASLAAAGIPGELARRRLGLRDRKRRGAHGARRSRCATRRSPPSGRPAPATRSPSVDENMDAEVAPAHPRHLHRAAVPRQHRRVQARGAARLRRRGQPAARSAPTRRPSPSSCPRGRGDPRAAADRRLRARPLRHGRERARRRDRLVRPGLREPRGLRRRRDRLDRPVVAREPDRPPTRTRRWPTGADRLLAACPGSPTACSRRSSTTMVLERTMLGRHRRTIRR